MKTILQLLVLSLFFVSCQDQESTEEQKPEENSKKWQLYVRPSRSCEVGKYQVYRCKYCLAHESWEQVVRKELRTVNDSILVFKLQKRPASKFTLLYAKRDSLIYEDGVITGMVQQFLIYE